MGYGNGKHVGYGNGKYVGYGNTKFYHRQKLIRLGDLSTYVHTYIHICDFCDYGIGMYVEDNKYPREGQPDFASSKFVTQNRKSVNEVHESVKVHCVDDNSTLARVSNVSSW